MEHKSIFKILLRWIIIFILIAFVFIWKKSLIIDAVAGIKELKIQALLLSLFCSLAYYFFDGLIISKTSNTSIWFGQKCSFYCAFYKLSTVGAGAGVAEVYYLTGANIPPEKGSGIMTLQYAMHKLAVTFLGIIYFILLFVFIKPADYASEKNLTLFIILAGIISVLICTVLITIASSCKFSKLIIRLTNYLLKKWPDKAKTVEDKISNFTKSGKELLHSKKNIALVLLLNIFKLSCWYSIPAFIFLFQSDGNYFYDMCSMGIVLMLSGVMISPAGVGTLEYVFSLLFAGKYGVLAATSVILYRFFTMIPPFIAGIPFVLAGKKNQTKSVQVLQE